MVSSFHRLCVPLLLLSAAPALAAGPPTPAAPSPVTERELRAMVDAAFPADGPGASVLVARGGRTIFSGGRGLADIAAKRAIAPQTPFYLGSITKTFTAALVLKLVEEGKLSLDDPISKHLTGFPAPASRATIRQLLNHSSGIMDYSKIPGFIAQHRDRDFTTAALVEVMKPLKPVSAPGTQWEYNNGGYVLLGAIVEKVTGQGWPDALRSRITGPLKLDSVRPPGKGRAVAASYGGPDAAAERVANGAISIAGAAGNLQGNALDLARFANALHYGRLLRPDLYRLMLAAAPMADGTTMPYGFGLRLGRLHGAGTFYQGGALRGGRTETLYIPQHDLFVAVLTNSDEPRTAPREMALRLAAAATGSPLPAFTAAPLHIEALRPLLGRYVDAAGRERLLFERGGKLWLAAGNSPAREVFAAGKNRYFFGSGELAWFELGADAAGTPRMRVHAPESLEPRIALRSGGVPAAAAIDPVAQQRLVGKYLTETGVTLVVAAEAGGLSIAQGGRAVGALRALDGGQYAIDGTPMRIEFVLANDRATGLRLFRGARILNAKRQD